MTFSGLKGRVTAWMKSGSPLPSRFSKTMACACWNCAGVSWSGRLSTYKTANSPV